MAVPTLICYFIPTRNTKETCAFIHALKQRGFLAPESYNLILSDMSKQPFEIPVDLLEALDCGHDFGWCFVPGERIQPENIRLRLTQNDPAQLGVLLEEMGSTLKAAPREEIFGFVLCPLAQSHHRVS